MPASIVLSIRGGPKDEPSGHRLLACVLDLVRQRDAALAAALHENRRLKPFTVSPLRRDAPGRPGGNAAPCWLRVTALDDRLADVLTAEPPERLRIGPAAFDVAEVTADPGRHAWADRTSYERLREAAESAAGGPSVVLAFHTPAAFSSNVRNVASLFPTPELVFRSLGRRWNAHADAGLGIDATRLDELSAAVRVDRYALATRAVRLAPRVAMKGFVGSCEYAVGRRATPRQRRLLRLLAEFAFFAGVGLRTTMGMGQVAPAARAAAQNAGSAR